MMLATKSPKSTTLPVRKMSALTIILLSGLMLGGQVALAETAEKQEETQEKTVVANDSESGNAAARKSDAQPDGSFSVQHEGQLITLLNAAELSALGFRAGILESLFSVVKQQEQDSYLWPQRLKEVAGHYQALLAATDDIQAASKTLQALKADAKSAVIEVDLEQASILFSELRSESLQAKPPLTLLAAEADAANGARALVQLKTEEAADYYLRASSALEELGDKHHAKWSSYADSAGSAFREAGFYAEANSLLRTAFELRDKHMSGSLATLESLNKLAQIKRLMAQYDEALPLYQRALAYNEGTFGSNHAQVAISLNNVADVYRLSGDYEQALPLYQRALNINRDQLGAQHPDFATTLNNLAGLYESTGKFDQALALYQEALQVNESTHGENHPSVATTLNNLAGLYRAQGKFDQAMPLYERDLKISRQSLGEDHPDVATTLNNLGILYYHMEDFAQSASYLEQALEIFRSKLGINHPNTVRVEESLVVIKQKLEG